MAIFATKSLMHSYTYEEYKQIVLSYAQNSKTSGEQSKERIEATLLNAHRIKRLEKQCVLDPILITEAKRIHKRYTWTLITESWCGDGAQCIPVIAKIAELNPNLKLEFVFRDQNPEFMDHFLTNGTRSIPKLICTDELTHQVVWVWGPRPQAIQNKVVELKNKFPDISHDELVKNIHLWYAQDKTRSLQEEISHLLNKSNTK